jgi:hypothetical protein
MPAFTEDPVGAFCKELVVFRPDVYGEVGKVYTSYQSIVIYSDNAKVALITDRSLLLEYDKVNLSRPLMMYHLWTLQGNLSTDYYNSLVPLGASVYIRIWTYYRCEYVSSSGLIML